jgi:alkylation response protein AidB-like acyl-CoA dehydrogenase
MSATPQSGERSLADEFYASAFEQLSALRCPQRLATDGGELAPFPDDVWKAIAAADWFRALVPEADGGLGLGLIELGAIFRAIGRRPVRGPLHDHAGALPTLLPLTEPGPVRDRFESALAGDSLVVVAEDPAPPFGRGPAAMRFADGRLSGEAHLVPFASEADSFVVVATDASGDPTFVVVGAGKANVDPMGSSDPCAAYGTVSLDGVAVEAVLASGAEAQRLRERVYAVRRLLAVAELAGATEELTAMSVEYAKQREQFGRPIGGFQAIRHILATMHGRTTSLNSLLEDSLAEADSDPSAASRLARIAKAHSSSVSRYVAEQALQVHGGVGFTEELSLHFYYRRVLTLEGYLGETSDLLLEIGKEGIA